MNRVLHELNPAAIPSQYRTKPKKVPKEFNTIMVPIPYEVLAAMAKMENGYIKTGEGIYG